MAEREQGIWGQDTSMPISVPQRLFSVILLKLLKHFELLSPHVINIS